MKTAKIKLKVRNKSMNSSQAGYDHDISKERCIFGCSSKINGEKSGVSSKTNDNKITKVCQHNPEALLTLASAR